MPFVKTPTVLANAVTMTAAAGDVTYPTGGSGYLDLTLALAVTVDVKFTNGGTGPTIPAQAQLQISEDPTIEWFNLGGAYVGSTANSAVATFAGVEIPVAANYLRIVTGSNTAQNVTLDLQVSVLEEA